MPKRPKKRARPSTTTRAILVDKGGAIVGKYRKVHLPGHADHKPDWPFQHLEKRYFDVGDLGFGTWRTMGGVFGMCICNDRRWPETYRVLALKGAEVVLLGYNTPANMPWEPIYSDLTAFHNHLCMQAGAYQNGAWVVGVAKAGIEEGCDLIGGSIIAAPSGEIVAQAATKGDELIAARCDLDLCVRAQDAMFNFASIGGSSTTRSSPNRRGSPRRNRARPNAVAATGPPRQLPVPRLANPNRHPDWSVVASFHYGRRA